ncbi:hypothetical protein CDL15_Pgr014569 [Punica granatum]|uniref:Uncharacterized protein n=1 Tax=Punica granatum TaxID=22663 RepID=A0A218WDZ8_PUNGR|nr:hypothetical protein CDL15_Pgr014569 [Punica granatum]
MDSSSHAIPFAEFSKDVQLCILSFLSLPKIATFTCTSKSPLPLQRSSFASPGRPPLPHRRLSCSSHGDPRFSRARGSPPPKKASMASSSSHVVIPLPSDKAVKFLDQYGKSNG